MYSNFNSKLYGAFHELSKEFSLHYSLVTKQFCKYEHEKEIKLKESVESYLKEASENIMLDKEI